MLELLKESLKVQDIYSTVVPLHKVVAEQGALMQCLADNLSGNATVVIWQMQKVVFGTWQNGILALTDTIDTEPVYWLELRAFNDNEEIHLIREAECFDGRLRRDVPGTGSQCVDSASPLWGERTAVFDNCAVLEDRARKIKMEIPVKDTTGKKYGLVIRSYIEEDRETGLSGYYDYRYMAVEVLEV